MLPLANPLTAFLSHHQLAELRQFNTVLRYNQGERSPFERYELIRVIKWKRRAHNRLGGCTCHQKWLFSNMAL